MRTDDPHRPAVSAADSFAGLDVGDIVAELSKRFVAFHRENPRNSRIPRHLRAAVVDAMLRGVTATRLRHTCGLSTTQLARWRAGVARQPAGSGRQGARARVFSVVDEAVPRSPLLFAAPPEHQLELRLGAWSVSVRLVTPAEQRQG